MNQIDYKKLFSKLSHIKALTNDQKFDQIVQNIIIHTLNQTDTVNPINENEVSNRIFELYGISIRTMIIQSNIDKLLNNGEIYKDPITKEFIVEISLSNKLKERVKESLQLEIEVKNKWSEELLIYLEDCKENQIEIFWDCLQSYLSNVFEQHGIQTTHFLNPSSKINEDDQKSLLAIVENIINEKKPPFNKEILSEAINLFIIKADETRTNYISQLADATFTSFALTSDTETLKFLNSRYHDLQLFLDTNFLFGILDLHKNSEDGAAKELLNEVKKNKLPFRLCYHPETLSEFKRAFDAKALYLRASKWTRESSRVAIEVDGLSTLEEIYHKQNLDNNIDPEVFLDKYDHVDFLFKDLGLVEYVPNNYTDQEHVELEIDIEKYQKFYNTTPSRKNKSFSGFKHDIVVLREVRRLNPKKTKFLESNAFFISSDFILAKFEKQNYKRGWEINYVVSPSIFLQLIRPFIEKDYDSNKRFIDTFSIPEFRTFEIDYSTTRSKALQILNDGYHNTSFETKVKILRDQVLLDKLSKANEDLDIQISLIENRIALENELLAQQNKEAEENISKFKEKTQTLVVENEEVKLDLATKSMEINLLKNDLNSVKKELQKEKILRENQIKISDWETNKSIYLDDQLYRKRIQYIKASKYCIRPCITLLFVAISTPLIARFYSEIKSFLNLYLIPEWVLILIITVIAIFAGWELLYRTYIVDKEKTKQGLIWISTFGRKNRKNIIINNYKEDFENKYLIKNPKPILETTEVEVVSVANYSKV